MARVTATPAIRLRACRRLLTSADVPAPDGGSPNASSVALASGFCRDRFGGPANVIEVVLSLVHCLPYQPP